MKMEALKTIDDLNKQHDDEDKADQGTIKIQNQIE